MKRILITGATGFLGGHLLRALADAFDLVALSTSVEAPQGNLLPFDTPDLNPDIVIHAHAAVASGATTLDDSTLYEGNVASTRKIVERFPAAAHLYFSTVSVYPPGIIATENSPISPSTSYAKSKAEGELEIAKAARHCIVRLSSLYGPGMKPNTLIPNYTRAALSGQIQVWGDGTRRQNYINVQDVASLVKSIIAADAFKQEIFLGVDSREYSNVQVANLLAGLTGAEVVFVNQDLSVSAGYDGSFTRKAVSWTPQISLEQGLKKYLEWIRKP